jgi:hypothetical protein
VNVRIGLEADMRNATRHVRFTRESRRLAGQLAEAETPQVVSRKFTSH